VELVGAVEGEMEGIWVVGAVVGSLEGFADCGRVGTSVGVVEVSKVGLNDDLIVVRVEGFLVGERLVGFFDGAGASKSTSVLRLRETLAYFSRSLIGCTYTV
jgi:hypothetical protein